MAPEMPSAMYSCGDTVLPVWPTWNWPGEILDHRELLGRTHAATTGDDDGGFRQLGAVTGDDGLAQGDSGGSLGLCRDLHADLLAGAGGRGRLDGTGTNGDHRGVAGGLGLHGERTAEDPPHPP